MEVQPFDLSRIDWKLCVVCQEKTKERLQCPAKEYHRSFDVGNRYASMAKNLQVFSEVGVKTAPTRSYQEEGVTEILSSEEEKWHKSCQLRYNTTNLIELAKECEKIALKRMKQKQ